jgi:hypothetical protein
VSEETKPMVVMVATPMYGGMCTGNYVQGLLTTARTLRALGVEMFWTQLSNESLIPRARNELVRLFLASDADYLMFIDADIGFDEDAVAALLRADKDVVCGIYPKKEINWGSVRGAPEAAVPADYSGVFVFNLHGNEPTASEDGLVRVRHGGTGFMLIKRRVFEVLEPHVPKFRAGFRPGVSEEEQFPMMGEYFATSIGTDGVLLSEDYHFCELWQAHGGDVYANPFIRLQHVGTYVFSGDLLKSNAVRNEV